MLVNSNFLIYGDKKEGYVPFVDDRQKLIKKIKLGYLNLPAGANYQIHSNPAYESVLVLLKGSMFVSFDGSGFMRIGPRTDMFKAKAWAVYIPVGKNLLIKADADSEAAVCSVKASKLCPAKIIRPEDVKKRIVGNGAYEREVFDIIGPEFSADKIMLGETINPDGNWSSFPPHKHDCDNSDREVKLEEVYYFRINPENGFGFQRIYNADQSIDEALVIKNHSVALIPRGYHPVSAPPGYSIYYLWVLAGEKRILKPHEDEQHAWISAKL